MFRTVIEVGKRSWSSILARGHTRREWVLLLNCGHYEYRYAGPSYDYPAPKKVRCQTCAKQAQAEATAPPTQ